MKSNMFLSILTTVTLLTAGCGGGSDSPTASSPAAVAIVAAPAASAVTVTGTAAALAVNPDVTILDASKLGVYMAVPGERVEIAALRVLTEKSGVSQFVFSASNAVQMYEGVRLLDQSGHRYRSAYGYVSRDQTGNDELVIDCQYACWPDQSQLYRVQADVAMDAVAGTSSQLIMNRKVGGLALHNFGATYRADVTGTTIQVAPAALSVNYAPPTVTANDPISGVMYRQGAIGDANLYTIEYSCASNTVGCFLTDIRLEAYGLDFGLERDGDNLLVWHVNQYVSPGQKVSIGIYGWANSPATSMHIVDVTTMMAERVMNARMPSDKCNSIVNRGCKG